MDDADERDATRAWITSAQRAGTFEGAAWARRVASVAPRAKAVGRPVTWPSILATLASRTQHPRQSDLDQYGAHGAAVRLAYARAFERAALDELAAVRSIAQRPAAPRTITRAAPTLPGIKNPRKSAHMSKRKPCKTCRNGSGYDAPPFAKYELAGSIRELREWVQSGLTKPGEAMALMDVQRVGEEQPLGFATYDRDNDTLHGMQTSAARTALRAGVSLWPATALDYPFSSEEDAIDESRRYFDDADLRGLRKRALRARTGEWLALVDRDGKTPLFGGVYRWTADTAEGIAEQARTGGYLGRGPTTRTRTGTKIDTSRAYVAPRSSGERPTTTRAQRARRAAAAQALAAPPPPPPPPPAPPKPSYPAGTGTRGEQLRLFNPAKHARIELSRAESARWKRDAALRRQTTAAARAAVLATRAPVGVISSDGVLVLLARPSRKARRRAA